MTSAMLIKMESLKSLFDIFIIKSHYEKSVCKQRWLNQIIGYNVNLILSTG